MSQRPFRILGIQQIAIGGLDKARLRRLWIDTLGLSVAGNYRSERENVDEDIALIGTGPFKCEVDLMQPLDANKKPTIQDPLPGLNPMDPLTTPQLNRAIHAAAAAARIDKRVSMHTLRHITNPPLWSAILDRHYFDSLMPRKSAMA
jgi:hypothetical protein